VNAGTWKCCTAARNRQLRGSTERYPTYGHSFRSRVLSFSLLLPSVLQSFSSRFSSQHASQVIPGEGRIWKSKGGFETIAKARTRPVDMALPSNSLGRRHVCVFGGQYSCKRRE
jgi:hypothetical protein